MKDKKTWLDAKTRTFIEDVADGQIKLYEEKTGKKYNPKDINSCIDFVNFVGGKVVYVKDLYINYNIKEMLISEDNNQFTIVLDKEYVEDNARIPERDLKQTIFRMVWFWYKENLRKDWNVESNKILYPKQSSINVDEIVYLIENNLDPKVKRLKMKKSRSND